METRKFKVIAKVPIPQRKTIHLRISDGGGMLNGNTTRTVDLETGTSECNLVEGQELQSLSPEGLVDPACIGCAFIGFICQAASPRSF